MYHTAYNTVQQHTLFWQFEGSGGEDCVSAELEHRFVSRHFPYQQCAIFVMALHNWSTLTRMIRWWEILAFKCAKAITSVHSWGFKPFFLPLFAGVMHHSILRSSLMFQNCSIICYYSYITLLLLLYQLDSLTLSTCWFSQLHWSTVSLQMVWYLIFSYCTKKECCQIKPFRGRNWLTNSDPFRSFFAMCPSAPSQASTA